jgi:hypothetical protein
MDPPTNSKLSTLPVLLKIADAMSFCLNESNAACQVLLENHPKQYGLHEKVDAADDKRKDDIMGTSTSAPSILTKHSHVLPPFNPLLLHKAPKIEPLQMNSLQTKFIVKTMHELRYSNALKRRKTETERGDNYYRDEKVNFSSFRAGNNASDDDSIASLSRSDSSMLDIFDELEAHPNVIQLIASSGGLITHCKSSLVMVVIAFYLLGSC